jgi:hypothetical protein
MLDLGPRADEPRYLLLRDRLRALFVLSLALVVSFGMILWSKEQIRPLNAYGATASRLRGVEGFPSRVDALKSLSAARRFSRNRELRGMVLDGVKFDGTLDLNPIKNSIKYVFQSSKVRSKERKQPDASTSPTWVCPRQVVKLRRDGLTAEADRLDAICPPELGAALPVPHCGPKEVWAKAIAKGATKEDLARLEYYRAKVGPAWKLQISKTHFSLSVSEDCKRELSFADAAGKVP